LTSTNNRRSASLLLPFLAGLAVRESLAPWTGHPFDFEIWVRLGAFISSGANPYSLLPYLRGLSFAPYPYMTSISYPPLSALIFGATYDLYRAIGSPSAYVYYFLLKQPFVISDVLVAYVLFKLAALKLGIERARKVALIWIFFPFTIIVSSMWGTLDSLTILLVLVSVYAFETNRLATSATLLGLSIFLKLMPGIFVPVFLLQLVPNMRRSASFAVVSLGLPLIGTLLPFYVFGWSFSGIFSAISYQGDLPAFGGMGIFNFLSLIAPSGTMVALLGWAWLPALIASYVLAYLKKAELVESLLLSVLLFSALRSTLPEQWALYPMAFLLLAFVGRNVGHFWAISGAASAFLLINNFLLVRFFAPISIYALNWDTFVDNTSAFSVVRLAILLTVSTLFVAEAFSVVLRRDSLLQSKIRDMKKVTLRRVAVPLGYLAVVSVTGGFLDFTATKMVTDWALAIQSSVFLGMSWLSLYHIMLVTLFEVLVGLLVVFAQRNLSESIRLFFLLTFLNFIAASLSLLIYRALEGAPLLATTTIYLANSGLVTERAFVAFAATLGLLGIFYLDEIRTFFLIVLRGPGQRKSELRLEDPFAHSLSPAP
jgi:hypothetical protein